MARCAPRARQGHKGAGATPATSGHCDSTKIQRHGSETHAVGARPQDTVHEKLKPDPPAYRFGGMFGLGTSRSFYGTNRSNPKKPRYPGDKHGVSWQEPPL